MTKEEFEKKYTEKSGVTVEWLHKHGQIAVPCDCGDPLCSHWRMSSLKGLRDSMDTCIRCLAIELPEAVYNDVLKTWTALKVEIDRIS